MLPRDWFEHQSAKKQDSATHQLVGDTPITPSSEQRRPEQCLVLCIACAMCICLKQTPWKIPNIMSKGWISGKEWARWGVSLTESLAWILGVFGIYAIWFHFSERVRGTDSLPGMIGFNNRACSYLGIYSTQVYNAGFQTQSMSKCLEEKVLVGLW